jgi:hypothetical protein
MAELLICDPFLRRKSSMELILLIGASARPYATSTRLSWCKLAVALHSGSPSYASPVRLPCRHLSPCRRATALTPIRRRTRSFASLLTSPPCSHVGRCRATCVQAPPKPAVNPIRASAILTLPVRTLHLVPHRRLAVRVPESRHLAEGHR